MGRKLLLLIVGFLLLSPTLVSRVFAQEEPQVIDSGSEIAPEFIIPPYPGRDPGFLGQDHSYTVTFRGNGEAVVSARVILTNKGEVPLSEISLRVPKVEPNGIIVYQAIRDKQCIRYKPQVYDPATRTYPPQICEEYQDPDYYSYYGSSKYQKAKFVYEGNTITITLPKEISPNKSGSYFIYYRAGGYTVKNIFGAYKYNFESLMVNDDVRSLNLGIDVDSDLVLRGGKGEVQYRFQDVSESTFKGVGGAAPLASSAIDTFYSNIGQGRIIKTSSNLAPLESYEVAGSYASNRLKLFAKEIALGALVFIVLLGLLLLVSRVVFKKLKSLEKVSSAVEKKSAFAEGNTQLLVISASIGFVSALLIAGYTAVVIVLAGLITSSLAYQYNPVFVFFLIVISLGVYGILLFAPALYLGVKKGVEWGIATVILIVLWLILFLGVAAIVLFLVRRGGTPGPIEPLPLLKGLSR